MHPFSSIDPNSTIAVGMSGGVDSSVSAYLLKQAGFKVFGLFMKNWEEADAKGQCNASKDQEDAAKVCDVLNIPFYTVNFTEEYYQEVFQDLLKGLKEGLTPNPDILCNKEIKFKVFLKKALALGADYLATGHYCQKINEGNTYYLNKGADSNKDQTYFVYTLTQKELRHVLFPIGHLDKSQVRMLAKQALLPTFAKKDSTGICFIGKRNFKDFISQYIPSKKGPILTTDGNLVGEHYGAIYYTLGQRKGLGVGGEGEAWFVVDKDIKNNTLYVAQGQDHPRLYKTYLKASMLSFVDKTPETFPYVCSAKIRYRQEDQSCTIEKIENDTMYVSFELPQRAVTTGQSIVFYNGKRCLGGGIIKETS
jgi:tRNA-specific 2-thiouridylase